MAGICALVATLCFFAVGLQASNVEVNRESRFLKLVPVGDASTCFSGLTELEEKIGSTEEKLLKVVELFRKLMMSISTISPSSSGQACEGGGGSSSANYSFTPNNSATLDNSNRIANKDIFIYNNLDQFNSGPTTAGPMGNGTGPTGMTTPPGGNATTLPTSPTTTSSMCGPAPFTCLDVTVFLNGQALIDVFFSATTMMDNSVEKCNTFCKLWGYEYSIISLGVGCFCTNESLASVICLPPMMCNSPCPGGGTINVCGGLLNPFIISFYATVSVTLPGDATMYFPSGKCYALDPFTVIPDLIITNLTILTSLTPNSCKAACMGYSKACTYSGNFCGCYSMGNEPNIVSPFQDYCIAPCNGNLLGVTMGITCGSLPPPVFPAVNCL